METAAWRMGVVDAEEGLYMENGALFDPVLFSEEYRAAAEPGLALWEWDARLRWQPAERGPRVALAYAEIRPGNYVRGMRDAGVATTLPPIQWAGVHLEWHY